MESLPPQHFLTASRLQIRGENGNFQMRRKTDHPLLLVGKRREKSISQRFERIILHICFVQLTAYLRPSFLGEINSDHAQIPDFSRKSKCTPSPLPTISRNQNAYHSQSKTVKCYTLLIISALCVCGRPETIWQRLVGIHKCGTAEIMTKCEWRDTVVER